jgi:hypothetical protein
VTTQVERGERNLASRASVAVREICRRERLWLDDCANVGPEQYAMATVTSSARMERLIESTVGWFEHAFQRQGSPVASRN